MRHGAALLLPAAAALAYGAAILGDPQGAALSLLSDDAFYYLKIAGNILSGQGCTFDGIARTNGFHPLWLLVVLAVTAVTGAHGFAPVLAVLLLGGAIAVATLWSIQRVVERHVAPGYGLVAVSAALLPNVLTAMLNGLETGIQLLCAVLLVWACHRHRLIGGRVSPRRLAALGVLLGLVSLCRLDSVFLLPAALIMSAAGWRGLRAAAVTGRLFALGAGYAIVVAPYVAWNLIEFGHVTPSSGVAKSTFPALVKGISLSGDKFFGALMLGSLWAMIAITCALGRGRRDRLGDGAAAAFWTSPTSLLAIGSSLHFVHVLLFMAWGVYWWHFTLYGLGIVFALPAFLFALFGGSPRLRRPVVVLAVASLLALAGWTKARELPIKRMQHSGWLEAAHWARANTAPGDVFALVDAGLFGYFSRRPVVNLDGKANSYEYLRSVEEGRVHEYLGVVGAKYVANIRVRYVSGKSIISIPRANRPSVPLVMEEPWEVYRSRPIPSDAPRFGAVEMSHFVIWKLPPDDGP